MTTLHTVPVLAVDFGTSNSAAAIWENDAIRRISIEAASDTLPTAVFFPEDEGEMRIGQAASDALIAGEEGRYMRALKSVLGLPLLHEERLICGRRRMLSGAITQFLMQLRRRAEAQTGYRFTQALSGRPVHFHSADPEKDAQAEKDLRACYLAAGFEDVSFLPEPEAAAYARHAFQDSGEIGLIVDIGGGTSDFTLFRSSADGPEVIASHGIRLGGTDFDQAVSMSHAMPALGLGGELRRQMGTGLLPVPRAPFVDLSTWAKIPFLYTAKTRRMVGEMVRLAVEPDRLRRLGVVLEEELGHELAFAVERGKIAANAPSGQDWIQMAFIARGLSVPISRDSLDGALGQARMQLADAVSETARVAGVAPAQVGRVVLVGGSSLMRFVGEDVQRICPRARVEMSDAFTAVVDGLAHAAR